MKQVIIFKKEHRGNSVICFSFERDEEIDGIIRNFPGRRWSRTLISWYIPNTKENLNTIIEQLRTKAYVDFTRIFEEDNKFIKELEKKGRNQRLIGKSLSQAAKEDLVQFIRWLKSKRYAENTVSTYSDSLKTFFKFFSGKNARDISNDDVIEFNNEFILANKYSSSYQNQILTAIKLFYSTMQNKQIIIEDLRRPRKERKLPNVLSKEETKALIFSPPNIKHRCMLCVIYACGLRRSELLNIKFNDIDRLRNLLIVRQSKGNKDRVVPLPKNIQAMIIEYYKCYHPVNYLFEGPKGKKYSESSLANVLKSALKRCGIKRPVTLHWLRHSYATHLLENGTDIRYIQVLLGHNSSRTTEIYTHVSIKNIQNIHSPFDEL